MFLARVSVESQNHDDCDEDRDKKSRMQVSLQGEVNTVLDY